ncbi:MAG: 50S ribosomal protein L5 [Gemmatimonadetes bacterium]|nr:50S ribosomal protein L5 [Gemmatimonadota bacterium]MXY83385.1 50S ribosomal protein L5 [Gemmatimonadota bacterium]MYB69134.1 50S ribosomal protein L5 [Gemmatimonadota bacterium]
MYEARLKKHYREEVLPQLKTRFSFKNDMQVPCLQKVIVNMGVGEAVQEPKALEGAVFELTTITGQKPAIRHAKKAISNFKLRVGMPVGCMVTLRGGRMYDFLDRLISFALPQVRDFRGVPPRSFDGRGNYNLGIKEQIIFPEINYDMINQVRGMNITIVTSAKSDEEGRELLQLLGIPFSQ